MYLEWTSENQVEKRSKYDISKEPEVSHNVSLLHFYLWSISHYFLIICFSLRNLVLLIFFGKLYTNVLFQMWNIFILNVDFGTIAHILNEKYNHFKFRLWHNSSLYLSNVKYWPEMKKRKAWDDQLNLSNHFFSLRFDNFYNNA